MTATAVEKRFAHMRSHAKSTPVETIGSSHVFMRQGHAWNSCEVSILSIKGKRFTVARCCDICDGLLAPKGSPKRKLKTWQCTASELW